VTHLVDIWRYQGLAEDWRIRFDDPLEGKTRYFDIRSIQPMGEMRLWNRLQCRELIGREAQS